MAANDFLPFAGGAGSNVLSQAAYAALAARTAGFSAGVAKSAELNKVWRQSSLMAAVIGQIINDVTGQDAVDDGTIATLVANLKTAIKAMPSGVVGTSRGLKCSVMTASASAAITADELIVESALGGNRYCLAGFSKTINLATTGAGGMDTGAAPNNGAVAIYAIYNPTTGASALLAVNATSAAAPNIYGGANMPSGYTASALVSVWRTNASGQLVVGYQYERRVSFTAALAFSATATAASPTSVSLAPILPPNAVEAYGTISAGVTGAAASSISSSIGSNSAMVGSQSANSNSTGIVSVSNQFNVQISASQTIFYQFTQTGGTSPSVNIFLVGYSF